MDVADAAAVATAAEAILKDAGKVDILVNNAGVTRDGLLMRMSDTDWDTVLNTNLKGAFNFTKAFTRAFLKQRSGRIINVASVIGLIGNAGQANYAASKAGLIGFTKSVAKELASRGVTANVLAPGDPGSPPYWTNMLYNFSHTFVVYNPSQSPHENDRDIILQLVD